MKVTLLPEQLILPATAPADVSVKLAAVTLVQSSGWEKFTDTVVLTATLVAPLAGMMLITVGGVVSGVGRLSSPSQEIRFRVAATTRAVSPTR